MKKIISKSLAILLLVNSLALAGCSCGETISIGKRSENVLRVASWDEYIDMGGEFLDPKDEDEAAHIAWYQETFGVDSTHTEEGICGYRGVC